MTLVVSVITITEYAQLYAVCMYNTRYMQNGSSVVNYSPKMVMHIDAYSTNTVGYFSL